MVDAWRGQAAAKKNKKQRVQRTWSGRQPQSGRRQSATKHCRRFIAGKMSQSPACERLQNPPRAREPLPRIFYPRRVGRAVRGPPARNAVGLTSFDPPYSPQCETARRHMKSSYGGPLERVSDCCWRIPKSYKQGMRVDGLIYSSDEMIEQVKG